MRLPEKKGNDASELDMDEAVRIMQHGFKQGINYVDTAYFYHDGKSEVAVGKAIKSWRDKVTLSSKSPGHLIKKPGDYRRILEEQLSRCPKVFG
jgi:predicted aldo/keto reductase-like oxidoreductase